MVLAGALACLVLAFTGEDQLERRTRIIEVLEREGASSDAHGAARELADPALLPELLEVLAAGGIPAEWTPSAAGASRGAQRLASVEEAVALVPLPALRQEAARRAPGGSSTRMREILIARLGERGDASDLALLASLARLDPARDAPHALAPALERSFGAIARRDARAPARLVGVFDALPGALRPSVAEALVELDSRAALVALGALLERDPSLDAELLWAIVRVGGAVAPPHDPGLLARVRSFLESSDAGRFQAAVHACRVLGDPGAIPLLVESLERVDEAGRPAVARTLSGLARLSMPDTPGAWESWLEDEERWWEESAPALLDELTAREPERVARAMRESAGHPLHAGVLARALVACLGRREEELVFLACERLRQLGSPEALAGLVEALDHPSPRVRAAAWSALRSITGKELPAEPRHWRALLQAA